ncbi:uncharacterized protein LOC130672740 isoform X2 [Microplitis mediator]|uniref:uncharacterized protein LOC130672740 isoform X2 n=1 Tax=Microplitis mediator TaxID=375433 RepID=UPI0025545ABE|nr:uncharacterized protein LOC130672740 isoform X2 [Microplitis mediator]
MNYFHLSNFTIWILIIVIHLNMVSVKLELVPIQKGDPSEWREYGAEANFLVFNSIYTISINEELLNGNRFCSGQCDNINPWNHQWAAYYFSYPNTCRGYIHYCWFKAKTEKRQKLEAELADLRSVMRTPGYQYSQNYIIKKQQEIQNRLSYAGNDCYCLCERHDNHPNNPRGDLIDSICYDPVSVDDGYVATGVRFKRHGNIVYLELQQGILSGGRIDPNSLKWKSSDQCSSSKKVVYNWSSSYTGLEIILEDMTLPENAVVTGVALGQSLRGRMINDDGNFDDHMDEIVKSSQCDGSPTDLVHGHSDLLPSTSLIGKNYELSTSCQHKIIFGGTAASSDHVQHIVPFVDLQAVVTDQNSPQPIRGIGWYYRSHPGYGGYLALKVFK